MQMETSLLGKSGGYLPNLFLEGSDKLMSSFSFVTQSFSMKDFILVFSFNWWGWWMDLVQNNGLSQFLFNPS